MRWWLTLLVFTLVICFEPRVSTQGQKPLDIYYIDVEGGAATLFVSPSGQSMLVDAGHPGTVDAERIATVVKIAGAKQIDYLVISHHHVDHVGGASELATRVPIRNFVDHGQTVETSPENQALYQTYVKAAEKGRRMLVKPGDTIPVEGLDIRVVSSGGELISTPLPGAGAPNPLCRDSLPKNEDKTENARSTGLVIRYGRFRTLALGDLTWNKELGLVCPNNLLGTVDVYLTTHHGLNISGPKAIVHALHPRVAVMNNGPTKGGAPDAWQIVRDSPGLEDFWQGHYAVAKADGKGSFGKSADAGPPRNSPKELIANLDEDEATCAAHWIKVSARSDGSFVVTNGRTGFSKTYKARA
jgi:beta-lactamase superfamily II metal-dependent hydrolase